MNAPNRSTRTRRTQEERSHATRTALLDATIECLVELGYAATTTTVIAERANVSRGAQLHHYPTKSALVSAALEHLATELGREFAQRTTPLDGPESRVEAAVDALWESYATPLFAAWVELAVAARTDTELRAELAPLDERLRAAVCSVLGELFAIEQPSDDVPSDKVEAALGATLFLLQGMAFEQLVGTGTSGARTRDFDAVLDLWKRFLRDDLGR
ncbi:MAG: TetR/AcrR family transcriptional regulator [Actinomycetota bacterium]|nr:TetR/AcrR family transcriptional regulator [Actinomycetota bacterium]